MEQSATQPRFVRILVKIARFIGIYLLSLCILYFLAQKDLLPNGNLDPALLFIVFTVVPPLLWALSKKFFAGFIKFAVSVGIIIVIGNVWPEDGMSSLSGKSSQNSAGYTGRYSGEDNGVVVEIVVSSEQWYGEVIEGTTGSLISNEAGAVANNSLYDKYGNELGEINGKVLNMSIQGQSIRLKKK